ncbi:MAG: hypothetical protein COA57_09255 [Flavobacteriales bacterium]|nr:hypothetical protein [Bacteroidales bacterium AH-315-I05]PCJ84475.1 MAG: hypothetical protein COA57_09255 [Flavobacteriales bacterium]
MKPKLIFVYNAKSDIFSGLADAAHKIFSPKTYQCNLCAITFGNFGMHKEWKSFLELLDCDLEFAYKNHLPKYELKGIELPAILKKDDEKTEVLINAEAINSCKTIDDLKSLILDRTKRTDF